MYIIIKPNKKNDMYVLTQDFQYTTSNNKILTLKSGTKIDKKEGDHYIISKARTEYKIHKDIVDNNPDIFEQVNLQTQIQEILKKNSKSTSPKTAKILHNFLVEEHFYGKDLVEIDDLKVMLDACRMMYMETENDKWLEPIQHLGWNVDAKGVFKE